MTTRFYNNQDQQGEPSVRIFASVGVSVDVPLSVLRSAALSRGFVPYYCVVIVTFLLIGRNPALSFLRVDVAFPTAAAALLVFGALGWFLLYLFFSVLIWARQKNLIKTVYGPLFTVPLVLLVAQVSILMGEQVSPAATGTLSPQGNLVLDVTLILLFEFLWVRYVAPTCIADQAGYDTVSTTVKADLAAPSHTQSMPAQDDVPSPVGNSEAAVEEQHVTSFPMVNLPFDLCDLNYMRSEQHMLRFHLLDREFVKRGRLKDLVQTMGNDVGMQINRSTWEPFASITDFQKEDNFGYVWFRDGRREKVTSARLMAFVIAYEKYTALSQSSLPRLATGL